MAKRAKEVERFIVLPTRGLRATTPTSSSTLGSFLSELGAVTSFTSAKSFVLKEGMKMAHDFKILDSIHEDGAKLVEMTSDTAKEMLANQPGLRIVPEVFYRTAEFRPRIESKTTAAATALKTIVTVTSSDDGKPVKGVTVVAFTDFDNKIGAQGTTNAQGVVSLKIGNASIERLYVIPTDSFWGALQKNITKKKIAVALTPIDLGFTDSLRHFYGNAGMTEGTGVVVGIVDTGVGPHPDLVVAGGLNTVLNEKETDFHDNGAGHGTHVGGIVAAKGTAPTGIRGLAPGVTLRSYRVFGKNSEGASNFAIAKAIKKAATDGCDIINLSLGGGPSDPATQSAIHDARQQGAIVIAATGNDERSPVSFPAADPLCIAVTALGRKGTFPKGTIEEGDVAGPFGTDPKDFIAGFSNIGQEADLTGPGVGVISTVPTGYVTMSGTSMASPAVAGIAARLLATNQSVLKMTRNQGRSDAIAQLLLLSAQSKGFPSEMEGQGAPS